RRPALVEDSLGFFRWGHVAGKILLTNDAGDWLFLSDTEFNDLLEGRVVEGHGRFAELQSKGFLREGLDLDALAARIADRNRHLRRGPYLHVVTLSARDGRHMTPDTAQRIADFALQSTSPTIRFELQAEGGEPLVNFEAIKRLVESAQSRNKRDTGKTLTFTLLTNCSGMTEEIAEWLVANDVLVSTTFDGPGAVHDANR